jgi:uncharacterized membrane protein YcjF (UPF0283 family)
MKKRQYFWFMLAIGFILLFLLMLLSSVLDVGDRLYRVHPYVAYGFYGLTVILVYVLLIRPLYVILIKQTFNIQTSLDEGSNLKLLRQSAKRVLTYDFVDAKDKEKIKETLHDGKKLIPVLSEVYQGPIKKEMSRLMRHHAKTVMISTAISQNGRLDFITIMHVNLRMIKELVELSGFRPSYQQLAKLSVNVITTALVAEGLENLDISDVLPQSTMNSLSEIPLIKPFLSSVTQGISNALLTLRIGIVTREFLFTTSKDLTKNTIRKTALLEAAAITPLVVAEGLAIFPNKIFSMFKPKKTQNESV